MITLGFTLVLTASAATDAGGRLRCHRAAGDLGAVSRDGERDGVQIGSFWRDRNGSTRLQLDQPDAAGRTIIIENVPQARYDGRADRVADERDALRSGDALSPGQVSNVLWRIAGPR